MNPVKKLLDWLLPPSTPNYYYRLRKDAEVEKVTETVPEKVEELPIDQVDVPLFTQEELQAMKKKELLELASDSGITEVTPKDTKKVIIGKIVSHYQL